MADLGAAHTAEKFLCPIGASAIGAVRLLVMDRADLETVRQASPRPGFVNVDRGPLGDAALDEIQSVGLAAEHGRQRIAVPLADHDDDLPLAALIFE